MSSASATATATDVSATEPCDCQGCYHGGPDFCENAPPCTCECCKADYKDFCLKRVPHFFNNLHDYGADDAGNRRLEMLLQNLLQNDMLICPCNLPAHYDTFAFAFGDEADHDAIREEFIFHYKCSANLEECDDEECEYAEGIDANDHYNDLVGSDPGAAAADAQASYC